MIAFLLAQSTAFLHELSHAASGSDTSVPANERSSLCKDCVSHAPLLIMAGGGVAILFLGLRRGSALQVFQHDAIVLLAARRPFAARAPPR